MITVIFTVTTMMGFLCGVIGQVPYEEGNCEGFSQIIGFLEDGRRLEKPAGTSEDV